MIKYLNHNFITLDDCDNKNPWGWLYCPICTIGAWYDSSYKPNEFRTFHLSRKLANGEIIFGPSLKNKTISCEEFIIKKLLE